jgi:uncharacterized protein
VLACLWVEKQMSPPPMEFDILYQDCEYISSQLREEVDTLLVRKRAGDELAKEPKIQILNDFLEEQIQGIQKRASTYAVTRIGTEELNSIFRKYI